MFLRNTYRNLNKKPTRKVSERTTKLEKTNAALVKEMSSRQTAEEKLKASFAEIQELKAALDEHAIVAITDPQGKITYVNDKFCAISKYSRKELLGQDHRIINSGYHSKKFIRDLWTTIAHGNVWHGEIKNRAKDGSFYWVATTIVPFFDERGKPRQYVAIRADITERKMLVQELQQLAEIIESSQDAILSKDLDGIITSWNPGAEKLFGYSARECIGKSTLLLFPPDRTKEETAILAKIRQGIRVEPFDTIRVTKNGKYIDVSATTSPMRNEQGQVIGASTIARDISARKQAEDQVKKLNEDLEQRVHLRTQELEAANEELKAFSYTISHDLRAPLRAMGGFARILEMQLGATLTPDAKHAMKRIQENATRMGELIDGLLDFSSLNWRPVTKSKIKPGEVARMVFEELRPEFAGRQVEIEIDNLPACEADPTLLKQVFVNLLSNAIKYSRDRNPALIHVGSEKDGGEVAYYVQDNGAGFNMEYAEKLFRVFQRLHTADQFAGTGVGLAIVQRIVQRHGGRVWAEGAEERGAKLYFTIGRNHG